MRKRKEKVRDESDRAWKRDGCGEIYGRQIEV